MKKLLLKDNIWWIGAIDHDLRVFDIIMYTEFGTTYNSYMIKGSEKTALVETVKYTFSEEYIKKVEEEVDLKDIDYIIVNHTEPDHAGTIEYLIERGCNPTVVGSEAAIRFLKEIANVPFKYQVVGQDDILSLGDKNLRFISAPFLHWPDSMYTYVEEDKLLFTCDSFGSHYAFDEILHSKVTATDDYMSALKYYFNMIFGPFKKWMLEAIDKIADLEIDMICTGHGPVLDENPRQIVDIYKEWSTEEFPEKKTVVIPYVAAYGYTKMMAEKVEAGLKAAGDIDVKLYDMVTADQGEVLQEIYFADGLLLGSPTINGDALFPIMDILIKLSPIVHNDKLAGAFGSYGWSGEAVDHITNRLKDLRMRPVQGLKVNFKPNVDQLEDAFDYGKDFGQILLGDKEYVNLLEDEDSDDDYSLDHTPKLWRCVICGEIFEDIKPPAICPACGATADQFELYVEELISFTSDEPRKVAIIGNGAAGISAAEAILLRNEKAQITIIDKEEYTAYYKPQLSDYIKDTDGIEQMFLKDLAWYKDNNVTFLNGQTVDAIKTEDNQLTLSSGDVVDYDSLIIASGANCFMPPIKNADLKGVFTLRNMGDAKKIRDCAQKSKKAVIVGGGLLGLETADELKQMGLDVTVVEIFDRILPRQLDNKGADIFEHGIKQAGINLITGATVQEIIGIDKVNGVKIDNGHTLVADMIIVSAGIRAETSLAAKAGLDINRGIIVNDQMQTSVDNIYAAGDVAEFEKVNYAIWPEAVDQGKVAGASAIGDTEATYGHMIPSNIFNGMEMNVFSIGDVNVDEDHTTHSITYEDLYNLVYKRLIFKEDKLIGGVIIGDNKKSKMLIDGMNAGASSKQMRKVFQ